jgi:adenylate kinase
MGTTIFIAGAYGTGKSTLCSNLTNKLNIPSFSAGDLISEQNGEEYGSNKTVADKNNNQSILATRVQELNSKHKCILLAGHFCIFNSANKVEQLPERVFFELNLSRIILLETSSGLIAKHLQRRDDKVYTHDVIAELLSQERMQAKKISANLNCPLTVYQMTFSDKDTEKISDVIQGG